MSTIFKLKMLLLMTLVCFLAACSQPTKFVAPEIDPPADLITDNVPKGFELISGFQLTGAGWLQSVHRLQCRNRPAYPAPREHRSAGARPGFA